MCIFLYNFCFSINYKCNFGEFLAILGNTEEFGNWDTSKAMELQWTEGDNWRKYISFKQKNDQILQYKYLVCKRIGSKIQVVRWEEGPDRKVDLKRLTKLFASIDDVWEHRKISFFLKNTSNTLSSVYIIGKNELLGSMKKAQEMKKVFFLCPIEKILQTFWFKQILLPIQKPIISLTFNYLNLNQESNKWEIIGNENYVKLNFVSEEDNAKKILNIENFGQQNAIKKTKSRSNKRFENPYYSRLEKNELQIFQDVALFEESNKTLKINQFLQAGFLNSETLNTAMLQNIKKVLIITNLKNVNFGSGNLDCVSKNMITSKNISVSIVDLNESKEVQLKECAYLMEASMKKNEKTLICWGNSKRQTFKILIEYFCSYKKFSVEAAKKFLKMPSSNELLIRKASKHVHLSR